MENTNEMMIEFDSRSCNEGFARVAVAAFCTQMNPTLEEVADLKTAISFTDMKMRYIRSVLSVRLWDMTCM